MLGPLRVHTGGSWVGVAAEQQRVVLAVLLVEAGRVVSTDTLVDAVWGERPPKTATNTIAAYVTRLRRLVGGHVLAGRRRGYELRADEDGDIDAVVFEQGVASGRRELEAGRFESSAARLGRALAMWSTAEPVLADVPPTRWVEARATQLEQLRLRAVEDHADALLRLGRHADIAEELDLLVREHPLRERSWTLLMTALDGCGRRAEALEAYQRARRVLRTELGLEPGPRLRELQQAILMENEREAAAERPAMPQALPGPLPTAPTMPQVVPAQPPADVAAPTDRADGLKEADALPPAYSDPTPAAVAMQGWPLVGRDEQLDTIRSHLRRGATTGVVISGEAGIGKTRLAREILALAQAQDRRTEWVAATGALASIPFGAVAGLLPAGQIPDGQGLSVLAAAAERLREYGAAQPVVIGVDDAHLLDTGSAALIGHLAAQGLAFVVATYRAGAPVADTITTLWKDGQAPWLDLERLPADAVDRLLGHTLNGNIDGVTRRRLHDLAAGNPLALRELLSTAITGRTLRQRHGVWHLAEGYRPQGAILQMLADRLRPLSPPTPVVLELLACGEPLPAELLAQLVDPASIDEAEAHGLAVSERAGNRIQVRLAHPLYGEVLRTRLTPVRARQLWWRLAGAQLATPLRRRDDLLRAALWQVEGGAVMRADIVRIGARQAINRADLALAERLARAARDAEPSVDADALLAEVLEYRGRSAEAAAVLPDETPAGDELLPWALVRAETVYWGNGDAVAAEQALALLRGQPGEDLAEAIRSWILLFDGRCPAVLDVADRLLVCDSASAQAVIWAAAAATAAAGFLGRAADAAGYHERGLVLAEAHEAELPWGVVELGVARTLAYLAMGELDTAWNVADDGYRQVLSGQSPMMAAGHIGFRGLVECAQGRPADAGRSLREAINALDGRDTLRLTHLFLAGLVTATALGGSADDARTWMDRADRTGNPANRLFSPWIALGNAWTLAAEGRLSDAVSSARYAADLARAIGLPSVEATARYDVLRLGGDGERRRLDELATALGTPLSHALARAAHGLKHADGQALSDATDALAQLGQHLLAAETAMCAVRAYRQAGLAGKVALALERAAGLRARCPGAVTPLLQHERIAQVLTRREREVALLAVRHSSRSIAQRLGLSPTTVNNTLARVYGKLGINNRAQLAALLDSAVPPRPSNG
ncbi:BTAD domain-containing putative transcriptional regulator [Nonomuraea sp. MTCD27]|uniref:BTAD domain-containing putative transcriptional regulator n=1 Tax=Nonomuraea sp. MTCD27 TaxID=1676747 RepID=UPI0035BF225E